MNWHRIDRGHYVASTRFKWKPIGDVNAIWSAELLGPAGWQLSLCAPNASGSANVTIAILASFNACKLAATESTAALGHEVLR